ncbi:MAG: DUF4837 family protein [Bacteroidetes bacterium]|nr:DUF4837 family protein [Bacteroidota bacterium]MBK7108377.1 DUF4837 family protein [Bacteroidota bacterium]MBK8486198.1 DUF4837 family protein [Bacteroidota bacterium]MBK8681148.1 DUF4837 family protein [Bacteroidota bacterium]MBP9548081.1 DUF4837 family protein [Chitinophagales bacterium]
MRLTKTGITLFFITVFFITCKPPENSILPYSVGGVDEIVVVLEKVDSTSALFLALDESLGATFGGTPQGERRFNILYTDLDGLNKTFIRHRNIVFIGTLAQQTNFTKFISDLIGEQNKGKVFSSNATFFLTRKDVWSKPQYIETIVAANDSLLIDGIGNTLTSLIDRTSERELLKIRSNQYLPGENKDVEALLLDKHQIQMRIPSDYKMLGSSNNNFIFLRKSTIDQSTAIMIWYEPYYSADQLTPEYAIKKRDSLGTLYEGSNVPESFMTSEHRFPFRVDTINYNGDFAIETRGLWRLVNDFMGGSFINYWIYDKKNNRIIYMDGYTYAPDLKKRPIIRELQSILTTMKPI